jgi:hypothetical protein
VTISPRSDSGCGSMKSVVAPKGWRKFPSTLVYWRNQRSP